MEQDTKDIKIPTIDEMLEAGLYFGHRHTKNNPKMAPFILTLRNNIGIIDLEKTRTQLEEALNFIQKVIKEGGTILMVGTRPAVKEIVKDLGKEGDIFYVYERWIGGTLTNFKEILKRIKYLKDLEEKKEKGELEKYTKKEQQDFALEIQKLNQRFGGIKNMEKLPDVLFIFDLKENILPAKEAKRMKIPVVALCDTNTDPELANFPIPCNDDAISSLNLIKETLKAAILSAKKESPDLN